MWAEDTVKGKGKLKPHSAGLWGWGLGKGGECSGLLSEESFCERLRGKTKHEGMESVAEAQLVGAGQGEMRREK